MYEYNNNIKIVNWNVAVISGPIPAVRYWHSAVSDETNFLITFGGIRNTTLGTNFWGPRDTREICYLDCKFYKLFLILLNIHNTFNF